MILEADPTVLIIKTPLHPQGKIQGLYSEKAPEEQARKQ